MEFDRPIIIAAIIFIILPLMFFLVVPEYQTFKELQVKIGEKRAEFNSQYEYFSEVNRVFYELEANKNGVSRIEDALPNNPSFGRLTYFFEKKAKENGLIVKDLLLAKYSTESPNKDVKEVVFSMSLSGSYPAFKNFIISLEKSARLFDISSISFSSTLDSSQPALGTPLTQFQTQQIYLFKIEVSTRSY